MDNRWTKGRVAVAVLLALTALTLANVWMAMPARAQPGDPCQIIAKQYTPITITSGTTTRVVAPVAGKQTYICQLTLMAAAADNVAVVEGTGGTCGTGPIGVIGGATAANGLNFAINNNIVIGNGASAVAATAGVNVDLCLITSSGGPLAGVIAWVQK